MKLRSWLRLRRRETNRSPVKGPVDIKSAASEEVGLPDYMQHPKIIFKNIKLIEDGVFESLEGYNPRIREIRKEEYPYLGGIMNN